MKPAIQIEQLSYRYHQDAWALQGVSLTIQSGEHVALLGANGAGKSTLLSHLNSYLLPQQGTLLINGLALNSTTAPQIRQQVGMVFQDADHQLFMPTVAQDVAFGPHNLGLDQATVTQRVEQALQQVGALHLQTTAPYHLSGGQKRAVAIATVLAMQPDILVMDEPSANLDPKARRMLIELLRQRQEALLVATHDLEMALAVCQRAIILQQGKVIADGPIQTLLQDEVLLQQAELERPASLSPCASCGQLPADHQHRV